MTMKFTTGNMIQALWQILFSVKLKEIFLVVKFVITKYILTLKKP